MSHQPDEDVVYALSVLVIGENWHGANSTALERGFRDLGCVVSLLGPDKYMPSGSSFLTRVLRKVLRPVFRRDFNRALVQQYRLQKPNIVVLFKGAYVSADTLAIMREAWVVNFFPDISPFNHNGVISKAIFKKLDHMFTTKSFSIEFYEDLVGKGRVSYLPHGCDLTVHRPLSLPQDLGWSCDVSFIGGWSPRKEQYILALKRERPSLDIKIWGPDWLENACKQLVSCHINNGVYGDLYSLAINSSKINLGLLLETPSPGDLITSRTFHIPAAGGFMLHERTTDVEKFLVEDVHCAYFSNANELISKVDAYLANDELREAVAERGRTEVRKNHSYTERARAILDSYSAERESR